MMTKAEFIMLMLFAPAAILLVAAISAFMKGQSTADWFRDHTKRRRR